MEIKEYIIELQFNDDTYKSFNIILKSELTEDVYKILFASIDNLKKINLELING
jgi:hypothetical protein